MRPCPLCKRIYVTCSSDMEAHKRVCNGPDKLAWKKSKFNVDDEYTNAENDAELCRFISQAGGKLTLGHFRYSLSSNGKYILKHRLATEG